MSHCCMRLGLDFSESLRLKVSENFPCEKVQGLELPWVSRRVKRLNEKLSHEKLEVDSEFLGIAENSLEDHTE